MKTVEKALLILTSFSEEQPRRGVSELARELNLHKTTVSRLLSTMRRHGFVTRDIDGKFWLGDKMIDLGRAAIGHFQLRQTALPVMNRLAASTGESVFLTVVAGVDALCLDKVEGPGCVRVSFEIGRRTPLHAGASARLLLAFLPQEQIIDIARRGLERFTSATITTIDELVAELDCVRTDGYAFSSGELDDGVAALAVPVVNVHGDITASLSLAGPQSRLADHRIEQLLTELRGGADAILRALMARLA